MEGSKNDEDKVPNLKITLLGDSGVGKSCIIKRYISEEFSSAIVSTRGANYSNKVVHRNGKALRLDLWDTAGQEQYRSLGIHFYRDSYVIILVYDITVRESFEDIKNLWYQDVLKYGEKYTILAVVGNKSDLYEEEQVSEEEGRQYAQQINAMYMLVSAKNGDNIINLFNDVVNLYWEPNFQEKIDELSNKDNGSVRLKKLSKNDEDKLKNKRKCCK